MASMASTSLHLPAIPSGERTNAPQLRERAGALGSWLARLWGARASRIDREVAALIEGSGGKFTDSLERAIERRLFDWH